jgi:hypothetical protein
MLAFSTGFFSLGFSDLIEAAVYGRFFFLEPASLSFASYSSSFRCCSLIICFSSVLLILSRSSSAIFLPPFLASLIS